MCGCAKNKPNKQNKPRIHFRQVLVKDRLGKVTVVKVPILPKKNKKKINIQKVRLIEDEVDSVLPH